MRLNIVPGQVGYELLVSVLLFVKNQEFLESLIWVAEPSCTYRYAQLTGMLNRGRAVLLSSSVLEMSLIEYLHSAIMSKIFANRASPDASSSREHQATKPQSYMVKTIALKICRYSGSNGQFKNTLSL